MPPDHYYFRTFIRLNTATKRLSGFNHRLYHGVGARRARDVEIGIRPIP